MKLSERLLQDNLARWHSWLPHPFTRGIADGTLPRDVFLRWLAQDYRFVSEGRRALAVLLAKAPPEALDELAGTLYAWTAELGLFREAARREGAALDAAPCFVTQAYGDFLLATAHQEPFAVGWAVLYGVERSYHDAWRWARERAAPDTPYRPWLDNWGSEAFGAFVAGLAARLDALAAGLDAATLERLRACFAHTTRLEHLFWEMAWHGEQFPAPG